MEIQSDHREIRRAILLFLSAIDGTIIRRYDKNGNVVDRIKVNYIYGPKELALYDTIDKSAHIQLPVVTVNISGISRDSARVKNKQTGYIQDIDNQFRNSTVPVPINIEFELTAISKFQADMEQILHNFMVWFDDYIVVSMKEPLTNHRLENEIKWNGNISLNYPNTRSESDQYQRLEATTSFTFKTWLFKGSEDRVGRICNIDVDYILRKECECPSYFITDTDILADNFVIGSIPTFAFAPPSVVCNTTNNMDLIGEFADLRAIFVSAASASMFTEQMSSFDYFPDSVDFPIFDGIVIPQYNQISDNIIQFDLPIPLHYGYIDLIFVGSCGYSKLTTTYNNVSSCNYDLYHDGIISVCNRYASGCIVPTCSTYSCTTVSATPIPPVIRELKFPYLPVGDSSRPDCSC